MPTTAPPRPDRRTLARPAVVTLAILSLASAIAVADGPEAGPESAQRIADDIASLVDFGTRHTLSEENLKAAEWLADRFRIAGCDEVHFHEFAIGEHSRPNVVATIRGGTQPDEFVLVGAHFDSRNARIADAEGPAPGANDNASGTAALLELARSVAADRPGRSVRFVAFSGEEQGLVGSRALAKAAKEEGSAITLMINLDMIGHPMDEAGKEIVVEHDQGLRSPSNDEDSRAWADRLRTHVRAAGLEPVAGEMYGSDYMPFEANGVVCVGLFDGADTADFYHDEADTPDKVDPSYCASATAAALALIREASDPGFVLGREKAEAPGP